MPTFFLPETMKPSLYAKKKKRKEQENMIQQTDLFNKLILVRHIIFL